MLSRECWKFHFRRDMYDDDIYFIEIISTFQNKISLVWIYTAKEFTSRTCKGFLYS